LENYQKVLYED